VYKLCITYAQLRLPEVLRYKYIDLIRAMSRSLRVAPVHIERVKLELVRNGFPSQNVLAQNLETSRNTINKFFNGKPIDSFYFVQICEKLHLNWQDIAEINLSESDSKTLGNRNATASQSSDQQIKNLPTLDTEKLHSALLRLGFTEQVKIFRELIKSKKIAACLLSGEPDCAQRWLLHRLLSLIPNITTAKIIPWGWQRLGITNSLNRLWRELGGRVGLIGIHPPSKIVEAIIQSWETQTVILIFQNIDLLPENEFQQFIIEFWLPLVTIASNYQARINEHYLLMFLVDYSGSIERGEMFFSEFIHTSNHQIPM